MRKTLYTDDVLVDAYLKNSHSTIKAASTLNCSRETVARAVRRSGIKLDGRKINNGHYDHVKAKAGSPAKVFDSNLIEDCKTLSRIEIAKKYHMNLCNVDRRLKKLNIKAIKNSLVGSGKNHYIRRAIAFDVDFDDSIDLDSVYKKFEGICKLCGNRTDITDKQSNRIGKNYPTIDHIIPLSKGGTHTWSNVQLAHNKCNARKQDKIMEVV